VRAFIRPPPLGPRGGTGSDSRARLGFCGVEVTGLPLSPRFGVFADRSPGTVPRVRLGFVLLGEGSWASLVRFWPHGPNYLLSSQPNEIVTVLFLWNFSGKKHFL
jgi:hypothetical protein